MTARNGPFAVDRSVTIAVSPEELWSAVVRVDQMPVWWPWLEDFRSGPVEAGESATFTVRAPLPYRLRFEVTLDEVVASRRLAVSVAGDLAGWARLDVEPDELGCRAAVSWLLRPQRRLIVVASRLARPLLAWGHDRIVAEGARQLLDAAFVPERG